MRNTVLNYYPSRVAPTRLAAHAAERPSSPDPGRIHRPTTLARVSLFARGLSLGLLLTALPGSAWAQASLPAIKSTKLAGNALISQVENFPTGALSVTFNGIVVPFTYDAGAQQLTVTLASVPQTAPTS